MISMEELLMGRAKFQELSEELQVNGKNLLDKLNQVRTLYGKPMYVNSGYRRQSDNDATANASKASKHMLLLACDFRDNDGELRKWCLEHLQQLKDIGIYLEDFRWTPNWVHMQIVAPGSGKRIFIPSSASPIAPDHFDGNYDPSFD